VARAQERADRLLHEHAVRQAAEEEAAAILAEAEAQATYTCDQADAYAVGELRSLQNHLNRLQRVVANGLQRLEERHQARLQPQQTEPVTEQETEPQNGSGRPPESRQMRA